MRTSYDRPGKILSTIVSAVAVLLVTLDGSAPTGPLALEGVRVISFTVQPNRAQLVELARLVDGGVVAPIVENVFPLAQAEEAFRRDAEGNARRRLVLRVVDGDRGTGRGGGRGPAAARRFTDRGESW